MRKSELYLPKYINRQLFAMIVLIVFSSCHQNNVKQIAIVKKDSIKPPVTVSGKRPTLVLLDTCPPPRKVIIPTKPGGFSLRKSDMGMKSIQSMPPVIKKAGLFAPMRHFNTEQGTGARSCYLHQRRQIRQSLVWNGGSRCQPV